MPRRSKRKRNEPDHNRASLDLNGMYNDDDEYDDDDYVDNLDSFIEYDNAEETNRKGIRRQEYEEFDKKYDSPKKKLSKECNEWLINIETKIEGKDVSYDDVMKLKLPEEENIWFVEYIKMLNNLYPETEEFYTLKNKIYEKYTDFKNNLHKKKENKIIIEKISKIGNIKTDVLTRIIESDHSDYVKSEAYRRYNYVNGAEKNEEYFKAIEWIDTVLSLPTKIKMPSINDSMINESIINLQHNLNEKFYGLSHVKEKIIATYCAMLTNPFYKKKFMAFVGPPGVGKTELGKTIASAFNLPFAQISCGGVKDSSSLIGHSSTYIGAKSGMFVNILRQTKYTNPVILIDEIDKISTSQEGQSIISVLLHVLDKTQNNHFQDMYMPEIPIDLSNAFFIVAMNDKENIDPNLKSRLCFVDIKGYTINEKIKIGIDYIFPKVLENLSFNKNDIIIDDNIMKIIVENYGEKEFGVRNLEKNLTTICEKINVLKYMNINTTNDSSSVQRCKQPASKRKKIVSNEIKLSLSYDIEDLVFPLRLTETIVDLLLRSE